MTARPYVVMSCAMSLDGYLDTAAPPRLMLSSSADFDRVDALRAESDVLLVGAETVRRDDPHLVVRSAARRRARVARSTTPSPWKVTITSSGALDPQAAFFQDDVTKLVYCPAGAVHSLRERIGDAAEVVGLGDEANVADLLDDLGARGVRRVLVEGGTSILTQFLTNQLVDELQLAVAPLFVGDQRAPRFVEDGHFAWNAHRRADLVDTQSFGDVVLLRYSLSERSASAVADADTP